MAPIAHYVASGFWHIPPIIVLLGSSLFSEVREQATQAAHYLVLYNSLDQTIREASEGVANPEGSICAYASAFPILHTTGRYTRWCFVPWSFPTYMIDLVGRRGGSSTSLITLWVLEEHLYNFHSNFVNYVDKQITSYQIVISPLPFLNDGWCQT